MNQLQVCEPFFLNRPPSGAFVRVHVVGEHTQKPTHGYCYITDNVQSDGHLCEKKNPDRVRQGASLMGRLFNVAVC